jgi:chromosome segregation ATPase
MATCDSQKLVLEGARRDMETQVSKFNTLLTEIASEVDSNQEMVKRLDANISSANGASSDEVDPSARLMSDLQQQSVLNDENIKQCDESTAAVRRQVADLQQEILSIDAKSPALEAEKKAAVAAKNYKEAGRVTNDLKTFAQRKIDCGVEIEALTARDESLQAERRTLISSKQQIQVLALNCDWSYRFVVMIVFRRFNHRPRSRMRKFSLICINFVRR